jgi:hypothetical protein
VIAILAAIDLDPATFVTIIGGTIAATGAVTIGFLKVVMPRLAKSPDAEDMKANVPAGCPISAESPIVLRDVTIHGVLHEVPAAFEARIGRIEQDVQAMRAEYLEQCRTATERFDAILLNVNTIRTEIVAALSRHNR